MVTTRISCVASFVGIQNEEEQVAALSEVILKLPVHNRLLLGWLMVHIHHITEHVSTYI